MVERPQARLLELRDPALVDVLQRHGVEKMELFAAAPPGCDQVGLFQHVQVLRDGLARHVEVLAQLAEVPSVARMEQVEQLPSAGVGERLEELVGVAHRSSSTRRQYAGSYLHVKGADGRRPI